MKAQQVKDLGADQRKQSIVGREMIRKGQPPYSQISYLIHSNVIAEVTDTPFKPDDTGTWGRGLPEYNVYYVFFGIQPCSYSPIP